MFLCGQWTGLYAAPLTPKTTPTDRQSYGSPRRVVYLESHGQLTPEPQNSQPTHRLVICRDGLLALDDEWATSYMRCVKRRSYVGFEPGSPSVLFGRRCQRCSQLFWPKWCERVRLMEKPVSLFSIELFPFQFFVLDCLLHFACMDLAKCCIPKWKTTGFQRRSSRNTRHPVHRSLRSSNDL